VRQAIVVAREDEPGQKRLVAYVVADLAAGEIATPPANPQELFGGEPIVQIQENTEPKNFSHELRKALERRLPNYMALHAVVLLEKLPLTPNGKLDHKSLPAPEASAFASGKYEAPVGEVEVALASIWSDVLRLEKVGRHDNFFDLGGHSLLAIKVVS